MLLAMSLLALPMVAAAASWTGTIQGLQCAVEGKLCPVGAEDPMAALEDNFVLVTGDKFYLLPNVKNTFLSRYINEKVKIMGEQIGNYNSIRVQEMHVMKDGSYKTVWSPVIEDKLRKKMEWTPQDMPSR
jgi:hypothetical protein